MERMGTLNLIFILLQSSLVTLALVREVVFWEDSARNVFEYVYGHNISMRVRGCIPY